MACRLFYKGEYYSEEEFNDKLNNDPVFAEDIRVSLLTDAFLEMYNDPANADMSVSDIMAALRASGVSLAWMDYASELQKIKSEIEDRQNRGVSEDKGGPTPIRDTRDRRQPPPPPNPVINSNRGVAANNFIKKILDAINVYLGEGAMRSKSPIIYEAFRQINNMVNVSRLEVEKRNKRLFELKQKYGGILTKEDKAAIGYILKGAPISSMALANVTDPQRAAAIRAEFFDVLREMRMHIDNLTSEIMKTGYLDSPGIDIFENNKGQYVVRVYEVHFNPTGWWYKLTKDPKMAIVFNNGKRVVKQRLQNHYDDLIALIEKGGDEKKIANLRAQANKISRLLNNEDLLIDHIRQAMIGEDESVANVVSPGTEKAAADLSLFKKRKTESELPIELRQMMGEIEDPALLYAASVERMTSFIAKWDFQLHLATYGEGVLFSLTPDSKMGFTARLPLQRLPAVAAMLGTEGSDDNAIYVHPEFKEEIAAMAGLEAKGLLSGIGNFLGFINSLAKAGVTVFSPVGHLKNFLGTFFFGGMNGYATPFLSNPSSYLYLTFKGMTQGGRKKIGDILQKDLGSSESWDYLIMLGTQTGLLNSEVSVNEIRQFMGPNTAFGKFMEKFAIWGGIQKDKFTKKDFSALSSVKDAVTSIPRDVYEGIDNLMKITALKLEIDDHAPLYGYKNFNDLFEKSMSSDPVVAEKARAALSDVSKEVSSVLRGSVPNYGESWKINDYAKKSPVIGMFTTFIMESFRTSINSLALPAKYSKKALNESDPVKRRVYAKIAARRALGVATMASVTIMAESFFRVVADAISSLKDCTGKDESLSDCWKNKYAKKSSLAIEVDGRDAFIRYYTPEWVRSVALRRDPDNPSGFIYEDPFTINPYGLFTVRAKVRSESRTNMEAIYEYIAPIFSPFVSPEIGAQTLWNIINGEDQYGNPISTNSFFDNPGGWIRDNMAFISESAVLPWNPAKKIVFGGDAERLDLRIRRNLELLEKTNDYNKKKQLEDSIRKDQFLLQKVAGIGKTIAAFGYKSNYVDLNVQAGFTVTDVADKIDELKKDYSTKKNKVDDLDKLYEEKNKTYKAKLKFLREMVEETRTHLGVDVSQEVRSMLRLRRFDKQSTSYILGYLDDAPDIPIKDYELRD